MRAFWICIQEELSSRTRGIQVDRHTVICENVADAEQFNLLSLGLVALHALDVPARSSCTDNSLNKIHKIHILDSTSEIPVSKCLMQRSYWRRSGCLGTSVVD